MLGGNEALAGLFKNGSFVNIYLSPGDYHRFHMPVDGQLVKTIFVPGKLYSVSPKTTKHIKGIFTKNERLISFFNTSCGPMAMVMVGAINVSSIETTWEGGLIKAPEKREKIEKDLVGRSDNLSSGCKVKMGQAIGTQNPCETHEKA